MSEFSQLRLAASDINSNIRYYREAGITYCCNDIITFGKSTDGLVYDLIIVGAGTSGSSLASLLVKHNISVLLIEAGGKPGLDNELPGEIVSLKGSKYDWNFTAKNDMTSNRYKHIQQGKVLGGTSQVNYMFYKKAPPKFYNDWARIANDSTWNYKNVLPYFKRNEKVTDCAILNSCDRIYYGTESNIKLKKYHSDLNTGLFESYKELGYKVVNDINPRNSLGYTNMLFAIGDGKRQSSAYKFLTAEKDNPALHVLYKSLVIRLIFDKNRRAVGVEILTHDKKIVTVKVRKEIVLTAGVIKTPQLLMLSGIGPKKHLEEKGVQLIADLPVGQNLVDSLCGVLIYDIGKCKNLGPPNPHEFVAPIILGYVAVNKSQNHPDYEIVGGVLETSKAFLGVSYLHSLEDEIVDRLNTATLGRERYFVDLSLLHPRSRGEVFLNSTNPEDQPIILLNRYGDEKDLEDHAKYVEHYNAILQTDYYKTVNAKLVDPDLKECKGLKFGTQDYFKCYLKYMVSTLYNYVGTCAMGSVVDSKLRVKGTQNLRIADASIIPITSRTTTKANVLMVAQKAYDFIKQEHNLC